MATRHTYQFTSYEKDPAKQFDIDFNKAVNMRIKFYQEEGNAPRSYIQANSNTVAKALKFIIRKIYMK